MQHNHQYKQAPNLAILAEIFIQYLEHNHIINILKQHNITENYRYFNDILIVYNEDYTNVDKTKLHGLSPRANYIDRATAACRRSDCQLLRIEGATWSA
jgi:hypothetical protein